MVTLLLFAILELGSVHALAPVSDRPDVQGLADDAAQAFARGDYEEAAEHLEEALVLEPDNAALVYGLAQAYRGLDDCDKAVELYDRFLRSDPTPRQRADAVEGRARCGATTPPPEPEPEPEPAPPSETTGSAEPSDDPPPPPRTRPLVGPILVGTGAGVAVAGGALLASAFGVAARAPAAATQERYLVQASRVEPLAVSGWSLLGVGVGVAVTGAITWAVQRRRRASTAGRRRVMVRR